MAPQYNVTLLTQVGKEAGVKLQQVIKSAATHLWSHGAVVSDVRPWGQRELAYRFGVNLIMHVLTGNYKSDQVHVPALLDRLGQ